MAFKLKIFRKLTFKKARKQHRWTIQAGNNRIIAASSEGYDNFRDMVDNLYALKNALNTLLPVKKENFDKTDMPWMGLQEDQK